MHYLLLITLFVFNFNANYQKVNLRQPKVETPLSQEQLMNYLQQGHLKVFDKYADINTLACAWGQVALENGHGKNIYNFNFGNIGTVGKHHNYYVDRDYGMYLSNESFLEGAINYWETLKNMCPSSLNYFKYGDVIGASHQLRRCGYYRDDQDHYTKIMSQLFYKAKYQIMKVNKYEFTN